MKSGVTILIFFFLSYASVCQKAEFINFHKYTQSNGLSSPNIRKIDKDYLGYIWIATQDGLNKFDGREFLVFNSNSDKKLRVTDGSDFHDFYLQGNIIWGLTSEGGLNKIDIGENKVLNTFHLAGESILGDWLHTLNYYNSFLYSTTHRGRIIKFDAKKNVIEKIVEIKHDASSNATVNKTIIVGNYLWLFTLNDGIVIYNLNTDRIVRKIDHFASTKSSILGITFHDLMYDEIKNRILAASSVGILEVDISQYHVDHFSLTQDFFSKKGGGVEALTIENTGDNLLFTTNYGIYQAFPRNKKIVQLKPANVSENIDWFENVFASYFNGTNIFLGNQKGLSEFNYKKNSFISYSRSAKDFNTKIRHSTHLLAQNDSIIYSCAVENGIYRANLNSGEILKLFDDQIYYQIIKLDEKSLLLSGDKQLKLLTDQKIVNATQVNLEFEKMNNDFIIASINYKDSVILMASQRGRGIYLLNKKTGEISIINNTTSTFSLNDLVINNFYSNKRGQIVVVCDKAITVLDFNKKIANSYFLSDPVTGKPMGLIMDCTEISNRYYFAVYGRGIVVTDGSFKVKKILSANEGIKNNGLYKIFNIGDSAFICSSNNGLYIFNSHSNEVRALTVADGLQSDNFEETSGYKTSKQIIFGGDNGFTVMRPERFVKNTLPPLFYFNGLRIQLPSNRQIDTLNVNTTVYEIPNNALQVDITFSGLNYSNPEYTRFAYRIIEQSKEWLDLDNQNFVTLIRQNPGTYHLQVKAANEDGVWSEPKEIVLIFLPKWYQTWWFKLLVFLTVVGIIYAFYRYRIRQIKKQHEIRKNIATDLHDDLGSTLNSVKVFTNLAISGVKQEESLQQIKDNLNEATMGLRDMIWVLDDSLDTVDELATRLKQYAIPVAAASNIQVEVKAGSEVNNRKLSKEEKRNLFLVCKEAINNSIKYSGASKIDVMIEPVGKKIGIHISDNGKGFDTVTVRKGYGLKNMQYRAGQIKYNTSITSAPGTGTHIRIEPL